MGVSFTEIFGDTVILKIEFILVKNLSAKDKYTSFHAAYVLATAP